jgi:hypothetical protein
LVGCRPNLGHSAVGDMRVESIATGQHS